MSKLDKDQVIAAFTEAYTKAHGKAPAIEAKGGWYSVDGAKNVRLADLNEQIATLAGGASETKTEAPAEKPKKAAPKKKAATKAKAKAPSFSVKAFWADKITAENAGARLPR